jgi:hypothetical protein
MTYEDALAAAADYSILSVNHWQQVDGDTVMHMMGYERNWALRSFQDAIGYGYDVHTLIFLCEEHIRLWSDNDDIDEILRYLKWVRKDDYPHRRFKDKGEEE